MPYITSIERLAKEEGREEGREEGQRLGLVRAIRALVASQFGSAGVALMPRIERLKSVDKLQRLVDALAQATPLDQFKKLFR